MAIIHGPGNSFHLCAQKQGVRGRGCWGEEVIAPHGWQVEGRGATDRAVGSVDKLGLPSVTAVC